MNYLFVLINNNILLNLVCTLKRSKLSIFSILQTNLKTQTKIRGNPEFLSTFRF